MTILGFGTIDAFWYVVAAFGAGVLFALTAAFRRLGRWSLQRVKDFYLDWFEEAIDTHIEPKFQLIRDEANARADEVREELRLHTIEEGEVVRTAIDDAIRPMRVILDERTALFGQLEAELVQTRAKLTEHMEHDDATFDRVGAQLQAGQDALLQALNAKR